MKNVDSQVNYKGLVEIRCESSFCRITNFFHHPTSAPWLEFYQAFLTNGYGVYQLAQGQIATFGGSIVIVLANGDNSAALTFANSDLKATFETINQFVENHYSNVDGQSSKR